MPPPPVTVKFPLTVTLPAPARAPPVICMLETACSPAPSVSAPLPDRLRTPDTLDRAALIDTAPVTAVTLPMSRTPGNTGSVRPVLSAPPYSTRSGLLVPVPPAVPTAKAPRGVRHQKRPLASGPAAGSMPSAPRAAS